MFNSSKPVTVTANEEGEVVVQNQNNPKYGYIRLEQEKTSMKDGFLNDQTRSTLIGGEYEKLNALGLKEGDTFPGKIVIEEKLEPFYDGQDPKINPETGEILQKGGKNIYRQSKYDETGSEIDDFIQHDTVKQEVASEEEARESITA